MFSIVHARFLHFMNFYVLRNVFKVYSMSLALSRDVGIEVK